MKGERVATDASSTPVLEAWSSSLEGPPTDRLAVFGITGDLARAKTFRSLYRLERRGLLDCPILGVAADDWTVDRLVERARESIVGSGEQLDEEVFARFAARLSYVSGDFGDAATYERVAEALGDATLPVFYLEIPPFLFGRVVQGLAEAGLTQSARVVVEKPFGHDLESARALAAELHGYIDEAQLFSRIGVNPDGTFPGGTAPGPEARRGSTRRRSSPEDADEAQHERMPSHGLTLSRPSDASWWQRVGNTPPCTGDKTAEAGLGRTPPRSHSRRSAATCDKYRGHLVMKGSAVRVRASALPEPAALQAPAQLARRSIASRSLGGNALGDLDQCRSGSGLGVGAGRPFVHARRPDGVLGESRHGAY
jgi:hypothetical protein